MNSNLLGLNMKCDLLGLRSWTEPPLPLNFFFLIKNIIIYIVLILAILFYKITFCFSLTISLILLRVILFIFTNFFVTFL